MSNWIKVLAAIAFGVLAGFFHMLSVQETAKPQTTVFIQVSTNLEAGDSFTAPILRPLELPTSVLRGDHEFAAVTWSDRSTLFDRRCTRALLVGDIIFHRDVEKPEDRLSLGTGERAIHVPLGNATYEPNLIRVGDYIGFTSVENFNPQNTSEFQSNSNLSGPALGKPSAPSTDSLFEGRVIGPFRIVTIGSRVYREASPSGDSAGIITVAGRENSDGILDEKSQMLLAFTNSSSNLRIVLYPGGKPEMVPPGAN